MAGIYAQYTTLANLKTKYLALTQAGDDTLIQDIILEATDMITSSAKQKFYPLLATRLFDVPLEARGYAPYSITTWQYPQRGIWYGAELILDDPLLSLTTLTNGDGTVVTASDYVLVPANRYPIYGVSLKTSNGVVWQPGTGGENQQVISVAGVWGFHEDYPNAWKASGATLSAAIISTSATTFTCTTGILTAGQLIRIDSEWMSGSAVAVSTSDTITVVRGIHGSTAATHLISAGIDYWDYSRAIVGLCTKASAALYDLRQTRNPIGGNMMIDGHTIQMPADVQSWLDAQIEKLGDERVVFG